MFRTKKDVDRHIAGILARIKDENEKKIRGFNFAKLYFSVKDYESATRYLAEYLAVNDKQASAHKLMGEIHEAAGRLKQALQSYKHSLALEENQKDVVLKICEIHCELPADQETTKYWLERAESLFPGHRIIFKLKESLTKARGEPDVKDMENLITSELVTRPLDVALRVKLLRLLLNSGRVLDAYKHALQAEEEPQFGAEAFYSLPWQRCLADVFEAYQENQAGPVDESFLAKYLLTLDQLASLALTNPSSSALAAIPGPLNGESAKQGERAAVEDAISAIESLDGLLDKAHKKKWTRGGAWDFVLHHVTGQLYLHMATLLLKRAWKENYNWQEARSWAAAMLLSAYSLRPPTGLSQESWFLALDSARQRLYRHVFLRAHHRLSVSGHIVHVLCEVESKSRWLSDLKQEACTPEVRKKIYRSLFDGEGTASWFLHDPTLVKCAFEFPTIAALQEHDQESQWLHPSSLNHLVWLALHWSSIQDKKSKGTEHFFEVRVFERLQREPHAFNSGAAETLSQMDTLAFLEATRYCAAQSLGRKAMRPSQGPLALPPHVGVQLCTGPQAEWWNAAYRLHTSTARDKMADYRRLLQRGLEVIRGIGNHGMDLTLVVRLARTFANRSSSMRADGLEEESKTLEDRAAHYWEVVISMLEKSGSPSSPLSASRRLFCVPAGAVTLSGPQETRALKQEAKMFLAVRAMNAGCLDEAAEMLSQLTTAQAAFYTALVMKKMAQRESPQRGVQHALLQRERAALQLALERGRREPDQALASAVRTQLDDLEGRLINISNGSFSDEAAETSWAPDVTSTPRSTHVSFARRPQQSSTPQVDRSFYPSRADVSHSSVSEQAESPTRQPRGQTAGSAASTAANEFVELQLRSLSLHQELVMSHLRQVLETNQNVLRELRDSHQAVLAEVKQQQTALEQLTKKVDDVATRAATAATASRAQRQREEADYVEEYTAAYESEYDPYTEYSHLEAAAASGAGPPHPVQPPAPLGYPPQFRGAPYASYPPPPPHLGYPLAPPPPLGRPLPPPLAPPQPFYSPQVAAAAAAVTTPGLCLAEGQPLPQFSFDISQPPPPTSVASSTSSHVASGDVGRVSAFSRLSKVPPPPQATMPTPVVPPVCAITPAAPALPPKPPNAPHAFQIPLPATGPSPALATLPGAPQGFSQPFPSSAAVVPTVPRSAAATPQLHGLLTGSVPSLASVAPEKQEPMTTIGTRTAEASPVISAQTPSPAAPRRLQRASTGSDDYAEEVEVEGNFKPLIPLPEEVSVYTGEENEKVCFEERAKLFRYVDKEWKERGIGVVKLLENQEGKVRLLMRREQVLKVCANHYIHSGMTLTPMPKKDTAWIWDAQDFADGEPHPEKFCIRFKTPEIAMQFKEAFEQAVNKSKQAAVSSSPAASTAASAVATLSMSPSPLRTSTTTPAPSKFESSTATTHSTFVISTPGFGTPKSVVMPPVFGSTTPTTGVPAMPFGSSFAASTPAATTTAATFSSSPSSFGGPKTTGAPHAFGSAVGSAVTSTLSFGSPVTSSVVASGSPPTSLPHLPATGFGKMFHPKPGAWACHTCYVSNDANKLTCAACDSPKPATQKPKTADAPVSAQQQTAKPDVAAFSPFGNSSVQPFGSQAAQPASVFKFGVPVPEQKPSTPVTSAIGGTAPSAKNVLGGFTFSGPPKVKELPKEEAKPAASAAALKESPKPSPFASFSFKSPPAAAKKDEQPEPASATQSFLAGARSEISKLSTAPAKQAQATFCQPLTTQPQVTSPLAKPSPPTSTRQRADSLRSPGGSQDDFVPSAEFEPVVPMPELVEVKTGEEDEEVLFCERAKLFRFDAETKQWKERGIGELKILRHPETQVCRVLMRRDQVLKLCANHRILPEMKLGLLSTNDRAWSWFANDYSEGQLCKENLAARFKTKEQADLFKQVFESCRDKAHSATPLKEGEEEEVSNTTKDQLADNKQSKPAAAVPLSQLSQFKPKPGAWNCDVCYVSNPADRTSCLACETPRPGSENAEPTPSPLKALEKLAAPVSGGGGFPVGTAAAGVAPAKFTFGFPGASTTPQPSTTNISAQSTPQVTSTTPKPSGFVFGSSRPGSVAPPSTFTFGMANFKPDSSSTNAPAATSTPTAFKFGSPQKYEFSFSGVRPRSPSKTPKSPGTPADVEEDESGTIESPEADIFFQPLVPLPPKVEVRTGEEEEEVLYSHRAKLYRWMDGEWKERGLGDIKLLRHPTTQRTRLLMRREPVLKVCLNHLLTAEHQFSKKDDRTVTWSATDFSDDVACPYQFALRLKSSQVAEEFLAAVEKAKSKSSGSPLPSTAQLMAKPSTPVSASTFSFRLEDNAGMSPSSAMTPAGGFSLGARFGSSKQTVVRSLFGNSSAPKDSKEDDDDVQFLLEVRADPADVARARKLMLPDNFYLYETKTPCPGCRGCDDWESKKKALAASSRPAGPTKSASTKDAPHLAAADSTTGSREDEDSGGGLFSKAAAGLSFADLAKQQPGTGFGFQGPSPKSGQSLFSGAGTKLFQSATSRRKSETEDDGADEVAPSVDIHFEPVVPLPDLVELRTGEEDEEQLFCHRAKLFVFDSQLKQWKERAIGDIKILKHKTRPCCFRVVMRRDQVHKVACNHSITEFTKLSPLSTSSNSLTWKALDFSEGKTSPEAFAVRFKNAEAMNKFAKVFEECRLAVVERGSQPAGSERNGDLEREQVEDRTRKEEEEDIDEEDDDDDDEYEDDDDDDEHGEDIMFEKRITLAVQKPGGNTYVPLGMGNLKMVYDDSCFGARIRVTADDGSLLCDTIVAVQTCLRTERLHAFWSAVDMSIEPNVRRHFQAIFSSPQAIAEFNRIFTEAKDLAVNSSIVETIDEPPSHPK